MNYVVLCTVPNADLGKKIAHALVLEGLAACVNVSPQMTSVYRWEGKVVEDGEFLLVIKTRAEKYGALEAKIRRLHPYEVPEVIALPVQEGSKNYLDWLAESTR